MTTPLPRPVTTPLPLTGLCRLLLPDGTFIGQGYLEYAEDRLRLRAITPSGAVARAFFAGGQRRFLLALANGTTLPVLMCDSR